MRREHCESSTSRLVLVRSPQSPEGNWPATELGEPALQLRLRGVVGETTQVQDLAALGQEGTNIGVGIHWPSKNLGVLVWGLGLADQTPKDTGESDGLFHSTARRSGSQCLQVEGQVVLDGSRGLNGLNLESGANVGEGAGSERQRLGVVGLPALIFGTQVESTGMLQIGGQRHSLITGLAGQLHT